MGLLYRDVQIPGFLIESVEIQKDTLNTFWNLATCRFNAF